MPGNKPMLLLRSVCCTRREFSFSSVLCQKKAFRGAAKPCNFDFVVVGGGVLGLATARELLARHPYLKLVLVEKECELATHQTTRHPGLIHSGIYFKPGSRLAELCRKGSELLYDWCDKASITTVRTGKLIVALSKCENERLDELYANALENNIPNVQVLCSEEEIKQIEPHCKGMRALYIPHAGSVCWKSVAKSFADDILCRGGRIFNGFDVHGFSINFSGDHCEKAKFPVCVYGEGRSVNTKHVVVCAGLFADRLARATGCPKAPIAFPMRAHYLRLTPCATFLVRGSIYPAPAASGHPPAPGLARWVDGCAVCAGPCVVPASRREGYKIYHWSWRDVWEMATYPGFWALRPAQIPAGVKGVVNSLSLARQLKALQRFVPRLRPSHVCPGPTLVYPLVVGCDGCVLNDLALEISPEEPPDPKSREVYRRVLHCRVAPAAAATACMAVAEAICDRVERDFFQQPAPPP